LYLKNNCFYCNAECAANWTAVACRWHWCQWTGRRRGIHRTSGCNRSNWSDWIQWKHWTTGSAGWSRSHRTTRIRWIYWSVWSAWRDRWQGTRRIQRSV